MDFLIRKDDLHETRFEEGPAPEPGDGEALLRTESFGLTSNNITYAVFGEGMNYWKFFPATDDAWGRMPVWGFAAVADPGDTGLSEGARVYGYLPPSSHLLVQPARIDDQGFVDAAPHRAELPSAYQGYRLTESDPAHRDDREDEQILFWPLFYTSFLIDDFVSDEGFFGADTVVLSSASSKTAVIAAFLMAQREGIEVIGLTSARNREFVEELGIYAATVSYEDVASLPGDRAVYVDMSGDGDVRASVHERYGARLAHSSVVGATHHDQLAAGGGELTGPRPAFFFAPDRIRKRGSDWGTAELERKVAEAWHPFAEWAGGWLQVIRVEGADGIRSAYLALLDGEIDPRAGHVVSLSD
jgi:NADPH:quinone reductase-like Zn-dependent oxidoreductase